MINKIKNSGFTLIETLIAVLLLAVAIAGPLTIASKGFVTATVAKDQVIAYYIAQDAVEYVRFARDTNGLRGASWLSGSGGTPAGINLLTPCTDPNGCYLDSTDNVPPSAPAACSLSECSDRPMYYDATNHRFSYNTSLGAAARTIFTRAILLSPVNGNTDEYLLTVTVMWNDVGGSIRQVVLKEHLYNWQP